MERPKGNVHSSYWKPWWQWNKTIKGKTLAVPSHNVVEKNCFQEIFAVTQV